jgi:hypothetical protein
MLESPWSRLGVALESPYAENKEKMTFFDFLKSALGLPWSSPGDINSNFTRLCLRF